MLPRQRLKKSLVCIGALCVVFASLAALSACMKNHGELPAHRTLNADEYLAGSEYSSIDALFGAGGAFELPLQNMGEDVEISRAFSVQKQEDYPWLNNNVAALWYLPQPIAFIHTQVDKDNKTREFVSIDALQSITATKLADAQSVVIIDTTYSDFRVQGYTFSPTGGTFDSFWYPANDFDEIAKAITAAADAAGSFEPATLEDNLELASPQTIAKLLPDSLNSLSATQAGAFSALDVKAVVFQKEFELLDGSIDRQTSSGVVEATLPPAFAAQFSPGNYKRVLPAEGMVASSKTPVVLFAYLSITSGSGTYENGAVAVSAIYRVVAVNANTDKPLAFCEVILKPKQSITKGESSLVDLNLESLFDKLFDPETQKLRSDVIVKTEAERELARAEREAEDKRELARELGISVAELEAEWGGQSG